MITKLNYINLRTDWRRYTKVTAFAVSGAIVGATLMWLWLPGVVFSPDYYEDLIAEDVEVSAFTRSAPVRLSIPKINLETTFEAPLGLNDDQTIEVPDGYEKVGWYKNGPTPGEVGSSVILGHVDSFEGPAVFYHLGDLETGDLIEVEREDGTIAKFVVDTKERYSRADFPNERVYGPTDKSELRLITCTGTFNHGEQIYSHNLVVYASLQSSK